ncbi:hypothetical protein ACA910_013742 [Epithemia clementina (nom. ined.)]
MALLLPKQQQLSSSGPFTLSIERWPRTSPSFPSLLASFVTEQESSSPCCQEEQDQEEQSVVAEQNKAPATVREDNPATSPTTFRSAVVRAADCTVVPTAEEIATVKNCNDVISVTNVDNAAVAVLDTALSGETTIPSFSGATLLQTNSEASTSASTLNDTAAALGTSTKSSIEYDDSQLHRDSGEMAENMSGTKQKPAAQPARSPPNMVRRRLKRRGSTGSILDSTTTRGALLATKMQPFGYSQLGGGGRGPKGKSHSASSLLGETTRKQQTNNTNDDKGADAPPPSPPLHQRNVTMARRGSYGAGGAGNDSKRNGKMNNTNSNKPEPQRGGRRKGTPVRLRLPWGDDTSSGLDNEQFSSNQPPKPQQYPHRPGVQPSSDVVKGLLRRRVPKKGTGWRLATSTGKNDVGNSIHGFDSSNPKQKAYNVAVAMTVRPGMMGPRDSLEMIADSNLHDSTTEIVKEEDVAEYIPSSQIRQVQRTNSTNDSSSLTMTSTTTGSHPKSPLEKANSMPTPKVALAKSDDKYVLESRSLCSTVVAKTPAPHKEPKPKQNHESSAFENMGSPSTTHRHQGKTIRRRLTGMTAQISILSLESPLEVLPSCFKGSKSLMIGSKKEKRLGVRMDERRNEYYHRTIHVLTTKECQDLWYSRGQCQQIMKTLHTSLFVPRAARPLATVFRACRQPAAGSHNDSLMTMIRKAHVDAICQCLEQEEE